MKGIGWGFVVPHEGLLLDVSSVSILQSNYAILVRATSTNSNLIQPSFCDFIGSIIWNYIIIVSNMTQDDSDD